ncbi:MAG: phosphate/phosphite/phosphonate ABC transporter substrate-binding protein [Desulfobulbaceae bacterium]|nr:phosphate/phosphite/phosphonate ABC transporter substrate-binding protein [Desulfobulbaceae bacterium]
MGQPQFFPQKQLAFTRLLATILVLFGTILGGGCENQPASKQQSTIPTAVPAPKTTPVRISVSAMISPKETFSAYQQILDYLAARLERPVELVQRKTYQEVNDLLEKNAIDAAFVCTGAYVSGHAKFGMPLLVAPQVNGGTVYYSYIIVPIASQAGKLADLQGKRFAFTDPMSNTGKAAPTRMLARLGKRPETFFSGITFSYSHDKSITAVAKGLVDGASVDSLVWEYLNRKDPTLTALTKVIERSEPYGIPPIVVAAATPPELRDKLKQILLHMHEDAAGRAILAEIMIDRFVEVNDHIYDSARKAEG